MCSASKDLLRNQDCPMVLGYELNRDTLTPIRRSLPAVAPGQDYGADPLDDGTFRMVPSGDIVSFEDRSARLGSR
jgi:hypothetical protein